MDVYKILIVEDDTDINHLLRKILVKAGYETIQAFSGTEALLRFKLENVNLIILDLMLPGVNGEEVLRNVREEQKSEIPVLVLSAKAALKSKVEVLGAGADDYITKPFEPEEILARVAVLLRRYRKTNVKKEIEKYRYQNLELYPESRKVVVCGHEISLTRHEYEILYLLVQKPGKVYSRENLYEQVWQSGYYGEDNTVNVHVSNIRKKIGLEDSEQEYIKTVWGVGFKMA